MTALTIRNVDDTLQQLLRIRAAQHGVSMEEEAHRILREALISTSQPQPMGQRLRQRFAEVAMDFDLPPRRMPRTLPDWDDAS